VASPTRDIINNYGVTSLYTNIPNHEGLVAIADKLRSDPEVDNIGPHLLKLLRLISTKTNFEFNGDNYLQIDGTSIGTTEAPSYAILFMYKLECKALDEFHLKPLFYGRYIDHIFMILQHGRENLSCFLEHMNNIHPDNKFTMEYSLDQVNFLDTTVVIDKIHKNMKLYTKPMNTHSSILDISTSYTAQV
jgi:hypothetical protein